MNSLHNFSLFEISIGNLYSWLCNTILEGVSGVTSVHMIDVNAGVILARRGVLGNGDDRRRGSHLIYSLFIFLKRLLLAFRVTFIVFFGRI